MGYRPVPDAGNLLEIHRFSNARRVLSSLGGPPEYVSLLQMTDRNDKLPWLLQDGDDPLVDRDAPHFREFKEVSENFMRGYRRFVDLGFPSKTIGLAMLGATVNIYTLLELREELPDLLRKLADYIESEDMLH